MKEQIIMAVILFSFIYVFYDLIIAKLLLDKLKFDILKHKEEFCDIMKIDIKDFEEKSIGSIQGEKIRTLEQRANGSRMPFLIIILSILEIVLSIDKENTEYKDREIEQNKFRKELEKKQELELSKLDEKLNKHWEIRKINHGIKLVFKTLFWIANRYKKKESEYQVNYDKNIDLFSSLIKSTGIDFPILNK